MADLTFINWKTSEILDEIIARYRQEYDEELEIGSDGMAIASAVAYILGVAANRFNEMSKQRYLDTATGYYLDGIGRNLINEDRPVNVPAKVNIVATYMPVNSYPVEPVIVKGMFKISYDGHIFVANENVFYGNADSIEFISDGDDVESCNGIPSGTEYQIETTSFLIQKVVSVTSSAGGVAFPYPYDDAGDESYREYIRGRRDGMSFAGTAASYKRIILESDSRICDAYILKDGDPGFNHGHVKAYVTFTHTLIGDEISEVLNSAKSAMLDSDNHPMNDIIDDVSEAFVQYATIFPVLRFNESVYSEPQANSLVEAVFNEYIFEISRHFNRPFNMCELSCRIRDRYPDIYTVYASNVTQSYVAPYVPFGVIIPELKWGHG